MDSSKIRQAILPLFFAYFGAIIPATVSGSSGRTDTVGVAGAIRFLSKPGKRIDFNGHSTNIKSPFSFDFSFRMTVPLGRSHGTKGLASFSTIGATYAAAGNCVICGQLEQGDLFYSATTLAGTITVIFDPQNPHIAVCSRSYGLKVGLYHRDGISHVGFGYKLGGLPRRKHGLRRPPQRVIRVASRRWRNSRSLPRLQHQNRNVKVLTLTGRKGG